MLRRGAKRSQGEVAEGREWRDNWERRQVITQTLCDDYFQAEEGAIGALTP
jgi:hypothetical protein